MVDIVEVSAIIAAAGVLVGVVYYILDLRHQTKIRETDLLVRLTEPFVDKEFNSALLLVLGCKYENYDDYVKRYGSAATPPITQEQKEFRLALIAVMNEMELFGQLLKRRIVSVDFMYDTFSGIALWEKVKPLVYGFRRDQNSPRLWENFESYYNEMKKREQQLTSKTA